MQAQRITPKEAMMHPYFYPILQKNEKKSPEAINTNGVGKMMNNGSD